MLDGKVVAADDLSADPSIEIDNQGRFEVRRHTPTMLIAANRDQHLQPGEALSCQAGNLGQGAAYTVVGDQRAGVDHANGNVSEISRLQPTDTIGALVCAEGPPPAFLHSDQAVGKLEQLVAAYHNRAESRGFNLHHLPSLGQIRRLGVNAALPLACPSNRLTDPSVEIARSAPLPVVIG